MKKLAQKGKSDEIQASHEASYKEDEDHRQLDHRPQIGGCIFRDIIDLLLREANDNLVEDSNGAFALQKLFFRHTTAFD